MRPLTTKGAVSAHHAEREAWARDLCQLLEDTIASRSPIGLADWDRTWLIVGEAGADFFGVLVRWEATGRDTDLAELNESCVQLLDAWAHAANEFRRHSK